MKQIDGLHTSKSTVCFNETVNFDDQNRRFTSFYSQISISQFADCHPDIATGG